MKIYTSKIPRKVVKWFGSYSILAAPAGDTITIINRE